MDDVDTDDISVFDDFLLIINWRLSFIVLLVFVFRTNGKIMSSISKHSNSLLTRN